MNELVIVLDDSERLCTRCRQRYDLSVFAQLLQRRPKILGICPKCLAKERDELSAWHHAKQGEFYEKIRAMGAA